MSKEKTTVLAIESSCDETAAAVVVNGREVLSNVISSQIDIHKLYGGVVPEIASRRHIEKINQVIQEALEESDKTMEDIDAVCVTYGPGLVGALLVGVGAAKALAYATHKPLVGVHHIEGHISANFIENKDLEPPFLCLVASGGHSHLVIVKEYGEYEILDAPEMMRPERPLIKWQEPSDLDIREDQRLINWPKREIRMLSSFLRHLLMVHHMTLVSAV